MKNSVILSTIALATIFALSPCGTLQAAQQQRQQKPLPQLKQRPQSDPPAAEEAAPRDVVNTSDATTAAQGPEAKSRPRTISKGGDAATESTATTTATADDDSATGDANEVIGGVPEETLARRRGAKNDEEQAVVPYYNNFMTTYRLGPEDVISVQVFDQPRYSKGGITVPPNGWVAYPLIKEGVFVAGKTTRQIEDEITKHLEEYIIDPKVTVSLEKAQSAIFSVMGDVAQPGIKPMTRRISVREALIIAGGVLPTGKRQVVVLRPGADGIIVPTQIDVAKIEKGKAPDNFFLSPGDQVFVPGNKFKTFQKIMSLVQVVSFARIFTGGF